MHAIPRLRWILPAMLYPASLPNMDELNEMRLWIRDHLAFLGTFELLDVAMTLGPALLHTAILCLGSLLLSVYTIPRATIQTLSPRWNRIFFARSIVCATAFYCIVYPFEITRAFYLALPPDLKPLFWRFPFSIDAWWEIRSFYWDWFYEHQDWKAAQKEAFATLVLELRRAFRAGIRRVLEVWSLLPLLQKFLIIAPAVLFYIYCDMIPAVRRIRRIYQRWRRRRREI
ncbi:hypothetical protein C8R46DRAFT_91490 [Mycena filopes]|nr:hypothetical protein C8R46DRAFT_91490 [Mycena filopes]